MQSLNLPSYPFKLKKNEEYSQIFDEVRKKWLKLTPEEWVRQHFIQFLKISLEYPLALLHQEMPIPISGSVKRADIVAHNRSGQPVLLVECKAPEIPITQKVIDQAVMYNYALKLPFLVVTNGLKHFGVSVDISKNKYEFITEIPHYSIVDNYSLTTE